MLDGGTTTQKIIADGGAGNDILTGGAGDDILNGDAGMDTLKGGAGNDRLYGGYNNDILEGGTDNDKIYGEAGMDSLKGGDGNDELYGGIGDDTLEGGADNDELYGNDGMDTLKGGAGDDILEGGADNDRLNGGTGDDILDGGTGENTAIFDYSESPDTVAIDLSGQFRWRLDDDGNFDVTEDGKPYDYYLVQPRSIHDEIDYFKNIQTVEIIGSGGPDTLGSTYINHRGAIVPTPLHIIFDGKDGDDRLDTGDGNDTLNGGAGNDVLSSGRNNDTLEGGSGADTISGGFGNDIFILNLGGDDSTYAAPLDDKPNRLQITDLDTVTDFSSIDKIRVDADVTAAAANGVATVAEIMRDANIRWTQDSNYTPPANVDVSDTNDAGTNDTIIYGTGGTADTSDDTVLMVLEDYNTELTPTQFDIV